DDDVVALRLEDRRRPHGFVLTTDEERERAAAFPRKMLELEVLDVDALRAECLRDAREHTGTIGHVHAEPLQGARLLVRVGKHAAPVVRRLADPACEEAGVSRSPRTLDHIATPAMLVVRWRAC